MLPSRRFYRDVDLETFSLIYSLEHFLRIALRWELRGRHWKNWRGALPSEQYKCARKLQSQEQNDRVVDGMTNCSVLSYMTLRDLASVILGSYWDDCFSRWLPKMSVAKADFEKLVAIRNKVAHFRPITERDAENLRGICGQIAALSQHYRRIRRGIRMLSQANLPENMHEWDSVVHELTTPGSPHVGVSLHQVSHHVAIEVSLRAGSFDPERLLRVLDTHESCLSFCRFKSLADGLCLYMPTVAGAEKFREIGGAVLEIAGNPHEGLSSEEVLVELEVASREDLLTWGVELPTEFSLED